KNTYPLHGFPDVPSPDWFLRCRRWRCPADQVWRQTNKGIRRRGTPMSFHFNAATKAIKVIPVLAAALAFNVLTPALPAGAFGINTVGTISTRPLVIGPTIYYPADLVVSGSSRVVSGDSFNTY